MGFANGLPDHGVDPEADEREIGDLLWPVVKSMATALIQNEVDYLIEGGQLLPKHVKELSEGEDGPIRACFIGFAEIDPKAKLEQIRRFGRGHDDWLKTFDDERVYREVEHMISFSA